jgi:hypothetical protein
MRDTTTATPAPATLTQDLGPARPPLNRAAWRFFHRMNGAVVGQSAVVAAELARAEAWLRAECDADRVRIMWDHDEDPDLSWLEPGETVSEVLVCAILRLCPDTGDWHCVASLCGITDPDRDYGRLVEAELASELIDKGGV